MSERPATILVVEDNSITRKMMRIALESDGYRVLEAPDGRTAVELMTAHAPDLAIQDLLLPDIDGIELCRRLRATSAGREMPILACSGLQSKLQEARSLQAGFTDLLFKPVEPSRLSEAVRRHLLRPTDEGKPGRDRSVLLVDDDPVQRKLSKLQLEQLGFRVTTARDGIDALEQSQRSRPDAIVCDVLMPRMNGLDFCVAVRQNPRLAQVPVVLTSSTLQHIEDADRSMVRDFGASTLVARTPGFEEVVAGLLASLSESPPSPASGAQAQTLQFLDRFLRQVEIHATLNAALAQRAALDTALLSIASSGAAVLTKQVDLQGMLDEVLEQVLDAGGVSAGGIYLVEDEDRLQLRSQIGFAGREAPLPNFFGHIDFLQGVMRAGRPARIPDEGVPAVVTEAVLANAPARSVVMAPLVAVGQPFGMLVMLTDRPVEDRWLGSVAAVATQLAQSVALSRTVSALALSEQRYRVLFETNPLPAWVFDRETLRILAVNDEAVQRYGYSPAEFLGLTIADLRPPEDVPALHQYLHSAAQVFHKAGTWRHRKKDGTPMTVEISGHPVTWEGRSAELVVVNDITERLQAEQALQDRELRFRQLTDNMHEVFFIENAQLTEMVYISPAYEEIWGRSCESLYADPTSFVAPVPPEDRERLFANIAQAQRGETPAEIEFRVVRDDGTTRWVLARSVPVRNEHGDVYRIAGVALDITDRKAAEQGLRSSELRMKTIVDSALDAVITIDAAGLISGWNPQAEKSFGWVAAEAVGRNLAQTIIPPAHWDAHRDGLARFLSTGEGPILGRRIEVTALHRNGREFPVELTVVPARVGDEWFFSAFVRDITERKQADEALSQRARLAELNAEVGVALTHGETLRDVLQPCAEALVRHLDAAFARIWTLNEQTQVLELEASAGLYTHIDGPHGRVPVGKFKIGLIAQERLPHLTNAVIGDPRVSDPEWAKREGMVAFAGYPLIMADRVVGVMAMFARHPFGDFVQEGLESIAHGIAVGIERKRGEEALRLNEERFRALVENSGDAVALLDRVGTITYLSQSSVSVLGYEPNELIGTQAVALLHPDDVTAVREGMQALRSSPETVVRLTSRFRHKGGDWHFGEGSLANRLHDPVVRALVFNFRDVTSQRQLEDQLRQAQKMEAVGRLAGGVAHDFNNLLTVISSYSELLLEDLPPEDAARREDLGLIRKAATDAAALTRQLLAFSRQQVLEAKVLDLNAIVTGAGKMLQRVIGEDIALALVLAPDLGAVKADPGQIEQVVMNLAVNARDAMPQGGKLMIETADVELDASYIAEHSAIKAGHYVQLVVTDTGVGMSEEVQRRIFEPFFTTKEMGKGTGLGLSTVYGIVKQSGGFIWVYSEPGHGTTFKIYLPRVDTPVDDLAPMRDAARSLSGTETVLLAEDDVMLRPLMKGLLERHGYRVLEAANGDDAITLAHQHGSPIQLLVTDVVMPGGSGRELARRLAEVRPETRVLYVSGYTDDAIVHHGMLEPGLAFLQKPFTPNVFARKVRDVLDAG